MKININHILFVVALILLVTYLERFLNEYRRNNLNVEYKQRKEQFERKIKHYEDEIYIDSVIISNMPLSRRDSLRAKVNPR